MVKERALLLGPHKTIVGVVAEPEASPAPERPIFVLLNAGIVHRVGPHRNSVKLARALAGVGFRVLRFDLSGIGDSAPRRDTLGFQEAALADLAEVLDELAGKYDTTRFALMGLCSGADNSFYMAVRDPRVVGAVLLDGIALPHAPLLRLRLGAARAATARMDQPGQPAEEDGARAAASPHRPANQRRRRARPTRGGAGLRP